MQTGQNSVIEARILH